MRPKTLPTSLAALLLLSGCASEPATHYAVSQQPIKGGYTDTDDKAVVGLVMFVGQGYGTCSGTLITPNIVLTAQHCIAPVENEVQGGVVCGFTSFGTAYDGDQILVTTETQVSQDGDSYYGVAEVITPPGDGLCGYDIALLVLSDAVPSSEAIPFPPRVDSAILVDPSGPSTESELYSAVGYGNTDDGGGWGGGGSGSGERRRLDNLYAYCEGSQCGEPEYVYETEWMGDTGICQGDSGGPALDTASRVIGVVSRGSQGCTSPVYTSVYGWRDWIMGVVLDRSAATGQTVPGWATGGATNTAWPIGGPCEDNADCFSGICHEGECSRQCDDEAPCPDGYACHPDSGICTTPPVGPPCTTDADCQGGVCYEGMCTRPCSGESCPKNYLCDDEVSLCLPIPLGDPCTSALDCDTGLCISGLCSRTCDAQSICPPPFGCDAGLCQLPGLGSSCVVDEDCGGGLCMNGTCTRPCDAFPCDAPWTCDADFLVCVPPPVPEMPDCDVEPCGAEGGGGDVGGGTDEPREPGDLPSPSGDDEPAQTEGREGNHSDGDDLSGSGTSEAEPLGDGATQDPADGTGPGVQSGGCQGGAGGDHWPALLLGLLYLATRRRSQRALGAR
jgi:hypothetical protein